MPVHASPTTRVPIKVPLWLLALFTFSGTLAMHIFVPALPYAAEDLGVGQGTVKLTVSLYIVGLALYTVAGFAAAVAPNAGFLITARLFQALGGCAGLVIGRAVVRDTALPEEAARRLALMNLMAGIVLVGACLVGQASFFVASRREAGRSLPRRRSA